ncbi:MAG: cation:proton antiporter [Elusimicrobia bacterium]|nr:cation:proton antiporter [Elusimicrobiota bacterium]
MTGFVNSLFPVISTIHLNILLLLGIALFGGTIGGKFFQRLKVPQVVGYIVIGIILGQTGLKIIGSQTLDMFGPFNYFALGLIGFMIGGELKKEVFQKYGRQFIYILFGESLGAFVFVSVLIFAVSVFFLEFKIALAVSVLLGAISSATAPAVTSNVLWEYKTRGPLTTTILGIVALDDSLALILFAIATSIVSSMQAVGAHTLFASIFRPLYEIIGAIMCGTFLGWLLAGVVKKYAGDEVVLTFSLGFVLFILGFAQVIKVDILLAAMSAGVMAANYSPHKSKAVFDLIQRFSPPIFVLFFVLFGAKLNAGSLNFAILLMIIIYFIARTSGKMLGAQLGARIAKAGENIKKYLPYCLFSQAGVAIGFSIIVAHKFPGQISNIIILVITVTTFIVEMVGPPSTKWAMTKAGEVGRNITEEDLMKQYKVKDLMDKDIPFLKPQSHLSEVLSVFAEYPNLYFPVVDSDGKLIGIVTIETIKETFMAGDLHEFLLAMDLMSKPIAVISPEHPVYEANQIMDAKNLESLPVVSKDGKAIGMIEKRRMRSLITKKLMELHTFE